MRLQDVHDTVLRMNKDSKYALEEMYHNHGGRCFIVRTDVPLWERIRQIFPNREYLRDDSPVYHQLTDLGLIKTYYDGGSKQWIAEITTDGLYVIKELTGR